MDHKGAIYALWSPQFIVAEGHNILEVTERLFKVKEFHSSLWSKATTVERSQWRKFLATLHSFKGLIPLLLLLPPQDKNLK